MTIDLSCLNEGLDDPTGIRDSLVGSYTDRERHVIMRCAFMNEVVSDPRTEALVDRWFDLVRESIEAAVQAQERLANATGLPGRWVFWDQEEIVPAHWGDEAATMLAPSSLALVEHAFDELCLVDGGQLGDEATTFVRDELRLPWPWVALELLAMFVTEWYSYMVGVDLVREITPELDHLEAPPIDISFATVPGETIDEAWPRLVAAIAPAFTQLAAVEAANRHDWGRRPSIPDGDPLNSAPADHARWFYRVRVKQPRDSIRSVATYEVRDRKTIRDGIAQAEKILGLGTFEWTSDGGGKSLNG